MNRRSFLPLMIAAMILPIIGLTYPVHAAGLVYISPGSTANQPVGSTFQIQVKVANIDPFSTFDIQVAADPNVISATALSVSGNIFYANVTGGTPFELVHCINGAGTGCVPQKDGPGIVHSEFADFGRNVNASGSGLLFTITYQVVGAGQDSPINIQNDVLAIGGAVIAHTTANGSYGLIPDFNLAASPSSLPVAQGQSEQSSISQTAINGFTGNVTLSANAPVGLTATLNPTFIVDSGSSVLNIAASNTIAPGPYSVVVTGALQTLSHSVTVSVNVLPRDFTIISSPNSLSIIAGNSAASTVNISPLNGFNGTVSLNVGVSGPIGGPTATLTPPSIAGGSGTSTLTISTVTSTTPGTYMVTVGGISGSLSHSTTVKVVVQPPPVAQNPQFLQIDYRHAFSFSQSAGALSFKVTLFNPNNSPTLFARIEILAVSDTGITTHGVTSGVITIGADSNVTTTVTLQFQPGDAGHRFTISFAILWGTSPNLQPFTSHDAALGVPTTDSLKVKP